MRIALACTGHRGCRVLQTLRDLAPGADLVVFSHEPTAHEPDYFDELMGEADRLGALFVTERRLESLRGADLLLCVGWRYMVARTVYEQAPLGAWVFHDSLLPAQRGFSPTVWGVRGGTDQLGVSLFRMTEEVDAGPVLGQARVRDVRQPMARVVSEITDAYLVVLRECFPHLIHGMASPKEQDHRLASYGPKWTLDDLYIDWRWSANEIERHVRAFGPPYPGAAAYLNHLTIRILGARVISSRLSGGFPGGVVRFDDRGVEVFCGGTGGLSTSSILITDAAPMEPLRRLSARLR